MKLGYTLADLFFPPKCVFCRRLLSREQTDLCPQCRRDLTPYPDKVKTIPYVKSWMALWHYDGLVRNSILRYKFKGQRSYAGCYGRLLGMKLLHSGKEFDLIGWVPISKKRLRERGYDQSEVLCEEVCQALGQPPAKLLDKVRHNKVQSSIRGYAQRKGNVLGAYKVVSPEQVAGKRILLLDDIVTTGATLSECARTLLTAGAKEVHCAALAASNHQNEQVKS